MKERFEEILEDIMKLRETPAAELFGLDWLYEIECQIEEEFGTDALQSEEYLEWKKEMGWD